MEYFINMIKFCVSCKHIKILKKKNKLIKTRAQVDDDLHE